MLFIHIMQHVHDDLRDLDLNLLVVLDALLAERHVTRAAARIGRSQPACSHALARLRRLLDDPLLVRGRGGAMVPTARALALAPALRQALGAIAVALRGDAAFDPATARRSFRIATGDYAELVLLPALAARLGRDAPGIDLWIAPAAASREELVSDLAEGRVDLVLAPPRRDWPGGIYDRRLFDEHFRCVVRRGHPIAKQRLTLARYCALGHLLVAPRATAGSFVDDALAAIGRQRRVVVAVPHFLVAPHVLVETDLIATLAARIVGHFRGPLGLAELAPPLDLPGFTISMTWHERAHHDPGQRWLRDQLLAVAAAAGA